MVNMVIAAWIYSLAMNRWHACPSRWAAAMGVELEPWQAEIVDRLPPGRFVVAPVIDGDGRVRQ